MEENFSFKSSEGRFECRRKSSSDAHTNAAIDDGSKCSFNWVDVTEEFFAATAELEVGELLHDEMFGLFEAMSAIEMMDPKMDAGMMCNRGSKKVLNFNQALEAGTIKIKDFSPEEHVGIIDATLACLVTWLEGHSLAQTVFTNLYLHNPQFIEDKLIRIFSIHSLKLLDTIREFINKASVFEEEDFQSMMYGYKLANDVPESKAHSMMKEVEEELQKRVKSTRVKPGEEEDIEMKRQHEYATALYSRIRFSRLLYHALLLLGKRQNVGIEVIDRYLVQCLEVLPAIERTIPLGIQPDPKAETGNRADYPTILGFEPLVNQRLLPPTFPRYTKIKTRQESTEHLKNLVHRLRTICYVTECTTFHSALDFLNEFSKSSPCVLSRSVLQLLYLSEPGKVLGNLHIIDVLRNDIKIFIKPPALMAKSPLMQNTQAKEYVEAFLGHCARAFCNLIQIAGHNRARQRDKLAHLLEELAALQDEADKVDGFLHSVSIKLENPFSHLAFFGTWVLYHTIRVMIQYLLSGFELELYSSHEYSYIYWYLYEFLYGWLVSAITRADTFLNDHENRAAGMQQPKGRSKKSKKKKRTQPHSRDVILNQALQHLCGGYYKAMSGFKLDHKLRKPCIDFDNEQVRYEHRFAPFASVLTPPIVQYGQYYDMTNVLRCIPPTSPEELYLDACKCFHHARTNFEKLPEPKEEVLNLIKVAKTNFVVMKLLISGHKKHSKNFPEFDFSVHKNFPIIKVL